MLEPREPDNQGPLQWQAGRDAGAALAVMLEPREP